MNEFKKSLSKFTTPAQPTSKPYLMAAPGSGDGNVGTTNIRSNLVSDRRHILQQYLQDLLMIPAIKESNQLKEFLDIRGRHPEFYNASDTNVDLRSNKQNLAAKSITGSEYSTTQSKGNFVCDSRLSNAGALSGSIDS